MLENERAEFRAKLPSNVKELWQRAGQRIAVVLAGGGARGAYEAGVLLAFQDASLPTQILTSTSIGAINAASYASHGSEYVGNAESLVEGWSQLTPTAVGIDWSRYIFVLAGLIAATAGFGNLAIALLEDVGIYLHLHSPLLTWFLLGSAGLAVLFFYSQLSYVFHVLLKTVLRRRWKPERSKVALSILANAVVLAFAVLLFTTAHLHFSPTSLVQFTPANLGILALFALLCTSLWWLWRGRFSVLSHKILRAPLRSGLFPNYERTRFLRERIHAEQLKKSEITVVMTAADLYSGEEKFLVNKPVDTIDGGAGVDTAFVREKFEQAGDLIMAVIASSAFPVAYEPVRIGGRLWCDGGLVSKQPVVPAIRLGADVLFLVVVESTTEQAAPVRTFLDVGMRAFDILMTQNVHADLNVLQTVNTICESHAAGMGVRPEQIQLEVGNKNYRYVKAFTVRPSAPLGATLLDFDGDIACPLIARGYQDGTKAVLDYLDYIAKPVASSQKFTLKLSAEGVKTTGMGVS